MIKHALLLEDDSVSREVIAQQLRQLGCCVDCADSLSSARRLLATGTYGVVLLDQELPDGDGAELLPLVAADVLKIALSAALSPSRERSLKTLGFQRCLEKPCSSAELSQALQADQRSSTVDTSIPASNLLVLNDEQALRAMGSMGTVTAMRALLASELPAYLDRLRNEPDDAERRSDLHKLLSACGFTGASALDWAIRVHQRNETADTLAQVIVETERLLSMLSGTQTA